MNIYHNTLVVWLVWCSDVRGIILECIGESPNSTGCTSWRRGLRFAVTAGCGSSFLICCPAVGEDCFCLVSVGRVPVLRAVSQGAEESEFWLNLWKIVAPIEFVDLNTRKTRKWSSKAWWDLITRLLKDYPKTQTACINDCGRIT